MGHHQQLWTEARCIIGKRNCHQSACNKKRQQELLQHSREQQQQVSVTSFCQHSVHQTVSRMYVAKVQEGWRWESALPDSVNGGIRV